MSKKYISSSSRELWQAIIRNVRYVSFGEFDYNIHISLKNNYLFVETPKVACSTLKLTLARLELDDKNYYREDIHDRNLSPLIKPTQAGNFEKLLHSKKCVKFCFVRNPYERFLSCYLNKVGGREKNIFASLLCQLGLDQSDYKQDISFETFITAVEQMPISMMDSHWRPQYYQTFQDSIDYDFIGRMESFTDDLAKVGELIGQPILEYLRSWDTHNTNSGKKLASFYTPELVNRVHRLFKSDFDYFGYDSELPE